MSLFSRSRAGAVWTNGERQSVVSTRLEDRQGILEIRAPDSGMSEHLRKSE
jgi:hypothetical protein